MRLKLLLFSLVWVTTTSFVAAQTQKQATINCLHDGYLDSPTSTTCQCRDGLFTGTRCEKRVVFNDGLLRTPPNQTFYDMGVICPPGFLGSNCQPVKCVGGQSQAFYSEPSDQMISFYITYNLNLQAKANENSSDYVFKAICEGFANSQANQLLYFMPARGNTIYQSGNTNVSCLNSFARYLENFCYDYNDDGDATTPDNCLSSQSLNFDLLSSLLDSTTPNSELYLVANYPANTTDFYKIPPIIRKAISRRIRIHVFSFLPPYLMSENDYVKNDGYQALRTLAESTLGVYVTPYSGVRLGLLGNSTVSDSITAMMKLRADGFVPAAAFSSSAGGLKSVALGDGNHDYYISVRTENVPLPNGDYSQLSFVSPPEGWEPNQKAKVDTGNWKLYQLTASASTIFFVQNTTALNTPVDWILYTKQTPVLFTAVRDKNFDASSPYGSVTISDQNLVGHVEGSNVLTVSSYVPAFSIPDGTRGNVSLSSSISLQSGCQFSTALGTVTCLEQGAVFVQTTNSDGTGSVSPFFCTGSKSSQQLEFVADFELLDDSVEEPALDAATCNPGGQAVPLAEQNASRSFAIISRNVRYIVKNLQGTDYSPVDRLYWNPGNIFEYLNRESSFYKYFVANLVTNGTDSVPSNLIASGDYQKFFNQVMDQTKHSTLDNNNTINWYQALEATTNKLRSFSPLATYSDIFVVIDVGDVSTFSSDAAMFDLFSDLYTTRSRVYFLTVTTPINSGFAPSTTTNDSINALSGLAAQTGGGLYSFTDFDNLMEFFKLYFDNSGCGLLGSDIVYQKMYNTPQIRQLQTGNIHFPAQLNGNNLTYWLHLYGTAQPFIFTPSCGIDIPPAKYTWGQQQRYDMSAFVNQTCNFDIQFMPPYSLGTSFIIYVTGSSKLDTFANIAFTDNVNNEVAPNFPALLQFGSKAPQYPVISNGKPVSLDIADDLKNIYSTPLSTSTGCPSFQSRVDYDFKCTVANNLYFFYTTFNDTYGTTHTRTYVTQCLSQSGKCANGDEVGGTCVCPPGFTGDICDQRICQNGGQPLISGLCNCTGFTGDFCENASGQSCINSPTIPDTRSEVSSIMFVVDKTAGLNNSLSTPLATPATLPGIQVGVVQYDCHGANTVLFGSDPSKLTAALTEGTNCSELNATYMPDAIIQALDSQISPRALLVLITSGGSPFGANKTDILSRLAEQRTDIRIFARNGSDPDLQFLATVGNGIVFESDSIKEFAKYYNDYIWNVIPSSLELTATVVQSIPRLSVVQTGNIIDTAPPLKIELFQDAADTSTIYTVYYIHTRTTATITPAGVPTVSSSQNLITKIDYKSGTTINLTITGPTPYSIEKMTTVLLGYGFQSSGTNEAIKMGLSNNVQDYLSFYTSRSTLYDNMDGGVFPYVSLSEIKVDNTIGSPVNYAVTRKNQTCRYNYYTIPIQCNDTTTLGYIAQFVTYTQDTTPNQRLEQKTLLCAADSGFTTTALPTTTVPTTTTPPPPPSRKYAFIIDTRGGDPNLFAMSQQTVTDFLSAYSPDYTLIFFTDQRGNGTANIGTGGFVANTPTNINKAFDIFTQQRILFGDNNYTDPTAGFQAIQKAYGNDASDIQEMFYLTQTGVLSVDNNTVQNLTEQGFKLSAVLYIQTDETNETCYKKNSIKTVFELDDDRVRVTNNVKDAVDYLVGEVPPPTFYTLPPITTPVAPACVKKAQASIFLSFETSNATLAGRNVVNVTALNQTYMKFLQLFPSDFELGDAYTYFVYPQYEGDPNGCTINMSRFEGQTQISGWAFSDKKLKTQNSILCSNNYPSLAPYIKLPSTARTATPDWGAISSYVNYNLVQDCQCSRKNDPSTLKVVVWLVFTAADDSNSTYVKSMTDNTNYIHIILAFGDADNTSGSLYENLIQKSVNLAKSTYNENAKYDDFFRKVTKETTRDLVEFVYTTICKMQNLAGTTAPTGGNTDYVEYFWREAELHPEILIRGIDEVEED